MHQAIDFTESSVQDCTRWEPCPCTARKKQEVHSSWMILTVLAEKSLASFNLQRRLRSCSYSLPHIYALIRLSNNLEEPPKSLVQSILSRILDFKGGLAPPKARPIKIPLLSHDDFRNATKKWLTNKVVPADRFSCSVSPPSSPCRISCSLFDGHLPDEPSQDDG